MQFVLHWAAPRVDKLKLDLEPFIEEDIDDESLWQYLEYANSVIEHVATLASDIAKAREIDITLVVGRPHWRYHASSRDKVRRIISILGPYVKSLDLSETSVLECARWISQTPKLTELKLEQISHDDSLTFQGRQPADIWMEFWCGVCTLPLYSLNLGGTDVQLVSLQGRISNLSMLRLFNIENAPNICQVLLPQLCHLRCFVLSNELGGDIQAANNTIFKGPVASRELRLVNLEGCTAPSGLMPAIADVSSHLEIVLLPRNATDEDVRSLAKLRILGNLKAHECELLTSNYLVIVSMLPAPRLCYVTCPWSQLTFLTRDSLFRLSKSFPKLEKIGFQVYDNRIDEKRVVCEARKALLGTSNFERWLKKFMTVLRSFGNYHLWINLEEIRGEPGYTRFSHLKRDEKVHPPTGISNESRRWMFKLFEKISSPRNIGWSSIGEYQRRGKRKSMWKIPSR
jgi:hypothetical protein